MDPVNPRRFWCLFAVYAVLMGGIAACSWWPS